MAQVAFNNSAGTLNGTVPAEQFNSSIYSHPLDSLLDKIRRNVGQIQKRQKSRVLGRFKEFSKSTSIGDELARYKTQLEKLRSDFIVSLLLLIVS
jgi:hypothetical protein